jgi:predicted dehydrogenase
VAPCPRRRFRRMIRGVEAEKVSIAIIGCAGNRGSWFTGQLARHPAFRVTALVDRLPDAARLVAEGAGLAGAPVFADTEEALERTPCDLVLVATPDGEHLRPVLAALTRGRRVFVEKPLAIRAEDCAEVVRADAAAGNRTMVGFNLRYAPFYRTVRRCIEEGRVGRVLTIQADEHYYEGRTYFRRWNRLRSAGGGLWITKASHDFDLLYWMAGALPSRVQADGVLSHYTRKAEAGERCGSCGLEPSCPDSALPAMAAMSAAKREIAAIRERAGLAPADLCLFNSDKDTFDHGAAQAAFSNGAIGTYMVNVVTSFTDRRLCVSGTEGSLEGSLAGNEVLFRRRHRMKDCPERIPADGARDGIQGHGGGDALLLRDLESFARGEPSRALSPAEASVAVMLGLAATRSMDRGECVRMADLPAWTEISRYLKR